jgi:hypothetical protein
VAHLGRTDASADCQAGLSLDRLADLTDDRLPPLAPFFDADEALAVGLGRVLLEQMVG